MGAVIALREQHEPEALYLGPATVTEVGSEGTFARLADGVVTRVKMALAFAYTPALHDVLLVISQGKTYYVIGLIEGHGDTALEFKGNVRVSAQGGKLMLDGDKGVEVRGPTFDLVSDKVTILAKSVVQKAESLYQRVRNLLSVQAGDSHFQVKGQWRAQAKRTEIVTEEAVTIQGKEVHLG